MVFVGLAWLLRNARDEHESVISRPPPLCLPERRDVHVATVPGAAEYLPGELPDSIAATSLQPVPAAAWLRGAARATV